MSQRFWRGFGFRCRAHCEIRFVGRVVRAVMALSLALRATSWRAQARNVRSFTVQAASKNRVFVVGVGMTKFDKVGPYRCAHCCTLMYGVRL